MTLRQFNEPLNRYLILSQSGQGQQYWSDHSDLDNVKEFSARFLSDREYIIIDRETGETVEHHEKVT